MSIRADELEALRIAVVGVPAVTWPGGYPRQAECCLIDAVLSIRARYGSPTTGVRGAVARWQASSETSEPYDDLRRLAKFVDRPDELAEILGVAQRIDRGRTTKAAAIARAAEALVAAGATTSKDVHAHPDKKQLAAAYQSVRGLGWITWDYFLMLLGVDGVKADVMVQRFVSEAVGREVTAAEAKALVVAVAADLGPKVDVRDVDHRIWSHQRRQRTPRPTANAATSGRKS